MPKEAIRAAVEKWRHHHEHIGESVTQQLAAQPPVVESIPAQPEQPTQGG